jgi:uncharacterized protein with GYD domain
VPTYVSLLNWTDTGVRSVKETLDRADRATKLAEKMGGTLREVLWTVGPYDIVAVADFSDDESATAYMLALGSEGSIRSTTLRAFSRDEMPSVLAKLG